MARARLRVIAGSAGGLRLEAPPGRATRPTTERVREAVFSSLGRAVVGASVLDLYAGTGAMAIEALSRGAARAVLVERDRLAAAVCRRNIERTGFAGRARVVERAVERFLADPPPPEAPFHLVCCDPPYELDDAGITGVLERLAEKGWLVPGATIVVERSAGRDVGAIPATWQPRLARTYGDTLVVLLSAGTPDPAP